LGIGSGYFVSSAFPILHPLINERESVVKRALLPLCILLLLPVAADAARVFRWVDNEGVTHFGDLPPNRQAERMEVRPIPGEQPASPAPAGDDKGVGAGASDKGAGQMPDDPQRAEYCRRYQEDLQRYRKADVLVRQGEDGERQELDEAQRASLISDTEAGIKRWCAPAAPAIGGVE
jgi:hypothetical protein